ncbi:MAG: hypothetical protein HOC23_11895 [Halieaceae bacterium]|jgi:uncharacterized membrane protein|nr:hypothetical protein [Halieaceae bacterium]
MSRTLAALVWCLIAAYPVIVLYGLRAMPLRYMALMLFGLAVLRMWFVRGSPGQQVLPKALALVLILVAIYTLLSNNPQGLRFYPVAVNATLLLVFAGSLYNGMPVVERLARLQDPELPLSAVAYTRQVTRMWCGFFLLNGLAALYTALYGSFEQWALYNGAIAYVLIALLFCGEWLVRRHVRRDIDV